MSRLVCWAPEFEAGAKRVFVQQMRRQARFCGVEVLTYCMMNNHFHILVRVPRVADGQVTDAELVRRVGILYPQGGKRGSHGQVLSASVLQGLLAQGGEGAQRVRRELLARMHDVSAFMRELKQRFSIWYNRRHGRHGTLWSERFKSVLVGGSRAALKIVGAYIDLNPVRAGLVRDPKDYVWSGYGAACGGDRGALFGLVRLMGGDPGRAESLRRMLAHYRVLLYGKGVLPAPGKPVCLDPAKARRVMQQGGVLSPSERLLCRMRALCHGVAFGGMDYVMEVGLLRKRLMLRKRKTDPVAVVKLENERLCSL